MAKTNIVDWKTITSFVTDAFVGYGIPRKDAEICADILLESDKRGIESHGVNRFKPIYLDRIKAGIQKPVTEFEVIKDFAATAVVDGHDGMGQVVGYKAMTMAIEKAKKYGMGMVVARNSCHYGIAGYYATMATDAGMIGITGTNARPLYRTYLRCGKYAGNQSPYFRYAYRRGISLCIRLRHLHCAER
ncbi:MAG: Ldh family oxidoreductase [[Clostridium] leptum]